jgi:hypothetical protein
LQGDYSERFSLNDGGVIEVESNSPDDDASKEAIRRHMQKIAGMFAQGDFSLPMFIHDTVPPGVEAMKPIATRSPQELIAVHEFLRLQIRDHRTGDSLAVQANPSS